MSKRATHAILLSTSAGTFQSIDQVRKMLDNLLPWLQRRSEKLGYSFVCFAGASMWHSGAGEVWCGKRGKKEFIVYTKNGNPFTDPHIHMILFGNPADALGKLIKSYLRENGIEVWYDECDMRMETAVPYVTLQCVKCRTASCNVEQLPQAALAEFFKIAEYNSKIRGGCAPVFRGLSDQYHKQNAHDLYHINTDLFINLN